MITEEMIKKRYVHLDPNDVSSIREIMEYNERIPDLQKLMWKIDDVKRGFRTTNLILLPIILLLEADIIFKVREAPVIFLLEAAVFVITIWKNNYLPYMIISALLMLLDLKFWIIVAVNLILGGFIIYMETPLKRKPGYPKFPPIEIKYNIEKKYRDT